MLMHKTSDQAKNQLKSLGADQGLEGWRLMRLNLSQRDGQRLEAEFDALTHLVKLKISDMPNLVTLLVKRESELTRFQAIDEGYALGKFQKQNIIHRALPDEIQRDVDKEHAKGAIPAYEDFIDFVKNLSRSSKFQAAQAPKPLTANLLQDETQRELEYSVEEWIAYIKAEGPPERNGQLACRRTAGPLCDCEGQRSHCQMAAKAICSNHRQWQGKRWEGHQRKGKGPFLGKCHNCDETGHMARDCTHPKRNLRSVENNWTSGPNWPLPSANGTQRVALCITDHPQVDYRIECPRIFPKHPLTIISHQHKHILDFRFVVKQIMTLCANPVLTS